MKTLIVTRKEEKRSSLSGKWQTVEENTKEVCNNVDEYIKNFLSFAPFNRRLGATDRTYRNYTQYGYLPVKNINTLDNKRIVTIFEYK